MNLAPLTLRDVGIYEDDVAALYMDAALLDFDAQPGNAINRLAWTLLLGRMATFHVTCECVP